MCIDGQPPKKISLYDLEITLKTLTHKGPEYKIILIISFLTFGGQDVNNKSRTTIWF